MSAVVAPSVVDSDIVVSLADDCEVNVMDCESTVSATDAVEVESVVDGFEPAVVADIVPMN